MVTAQPLHVVPPSTRRARSSVVTTSDVASLVRIFDDGVSIVILERPLDDGLQAAVARLMPTVGYTRKVVVSSAQHGGDALGVERALGDDVALWAGVMADLTGADLVGVRLARCDHAMCPRLHVDRVMLRICITYAGAGTEYLADLDADRRRLGMAGQHADETSGLVRSGGQIARTPTGAVVLLKGEAWPENLGGGAIHRSPATCPEAPRLVLTLDALG